MNSKILLGTSGVALFLAGTISALLLGPRQELSIFKDRFWMNYSEIYGFLILGFLGIAGFYLVSDKSVVKWLATIIIILAVIIVLFQISQRLPF